MASGYASDDSISTTSTVPEEVDPNAEYVIETILAQRGSNATRQYLIKWADYPEESNTWEPHKEMPDVALEEWISTRERIRDGLEPPYDVEAWEERVRTTEKIKQDEKKARHRRREAKRQARRLALAARKECKAAVKNGSKRKARVDTDSSGEAVEENEIDEDRGIPFRAGLQSKMKKRQKFTTPFIEEDSDGDTHSPPQQARKGSSTARSSLEQTPRVAADERTSSGRVEVR